VKENSSEAEVTIYTDENHLYYPRPRLYEVITKEKSPEEIYASPQQYYDSHGIKVNLNKKVLGINTADKQLLLADQSKTDYDKLLLANGASPSRPPIEGAEKQGVFTLRTINDALMIRDYAKRTSKAIVIGGGLLGLEFAACLRKAGQHVSIIEINPRLLPRQLDQQAEILLRNELEALGIDTTLNAKTKEILGKDAVSGVLLDDGKELPGGLILIAAGIRSNIEMAAQAGIKVGKGVIVDEYMRTSANEVYAAGDIAEINGTVYGMIPPSIEQAKTAAANILAEEKAVYKDTLRYTTLKIGGINLTSFGLVNPQGPQFEEIKKINKEKNIYKKIVLEQGRIVGAIFLGDRRSVPETLKLMDQNTDVAKYKDLLLEDTFDFRQIDF